MFGSVVPVLVPVPLDGPFDYRLDDGQAPPAGTYVAVPFAGRELIGVVWDEAPARPVPSSRLKPLGAVLDAPPMPRDAAGTGHPHGAGDAGAARIGAEAGAQRPGGAGAVADQARLSPGRGRAARARLSRQRAAVLAALPEGAVVPAPALAKAAGVGAGVVQAMARDGLLAPVP